ncbi:MAG TPA: glycosyltransferase family 39 protein [Chloroflexota bacterium]|nr:glycosyltransferase family 39 protein [Chloroflexota bacterium]
MLARSIEWAPLIGLAGLALAIRWPYLWDVPQFTDESVDILWSYGIYQGKRPLTGFNAYTGPFHYYLQAALFWLFGPSVYIPRLLVMVLGVGAVVATYLLGEEVGRALTPRSALVPNPSPSRGEGSVEPAEARVRLAGRWAGLVAGGLLATNASHIVASSHLAWPHSTLALYLTLSFWLLERALRLASGPLLVAAGLAFGLAQQQHPTILLLWPVFIAYVLWRGGWFFTTRWAYLAIAAFLIGTSPLVIYNLRSGLGSLRESEEQRAAYQQGRDKDFSYGGRAAEVLLTSARLPASAIDQRPTAVDYLRDPTVLGYTALVLAGLGLTARLGLFGPLLAVLAFLVLLPLFPASHDNLPRQARYLMPMLPLVYAGVGGLAAWAAVRVRGHHRAELGLAIAAIALVGYPLLPLASYYADIFAAGETNARYFITLEAAERLRRADEPVVLDPTLQRDRPGAGATAQRTFDYLFTLRGVPHVTLEQSSERLDRRVPGSTALAVADESPSSVASLTNAPTWRAEELPDAAPGGFALWRLSRR